MKRRAIFLIGAGSLAGLMIVSFFLPRPMRPTGEERLRLHSIVFLASVASEYRVKHGSGPNSFHDLLEYIDERPISDSVKWRKLWPDWAFKYLGERPADWNALDVPGDDVGAYRFVSDGNSEYVLTERSIVPSLRRGRFAVTREKLEVAQIKE